MKKSVTQTLENISSFRHTAVILHTKVKQINNRTENNIQTKSPKQSTNFLNKV